MVRVEIQHVLEIAAGFGGSIAGRPCSREDVGHLQQPGLAGLDGVPPTGA